MTVPGVYSPEQSINQEAFTPTVEGERRRFERMSLDERVAAVVAESLQRLTVKMNDIFLEARAAVATDDDALVEIMALAHFERSQEIAWEGGSVPLRWEAISCSDRVMLVDRMSAALNALREHGKDKS